MRKKDKKIKGKSIIDSEKSIGSVTNKKDRPY